MALIKCPECGKEISDIAPACIHCGYPTQKQTESSTTKYYSVILRDCGLNKLAVIKYIRELTNLSLSEGKDLAEKTPSVLVQNVTLNEANKVKAELDKLSAFSVIEEYSEKQERPKTTEHNSFESQDKKPVSKGKTITIVVLAAIILAVVFYKTVFVRTISSGDGWKHQHTLISGQCELCEKQGNDRIHSIIGNDYYCPEHWESFGKEYFQSLAKESEEVRCWYCSKVIVNSEGRIIHCHQDAKNPYIYICDYCGKDNVLK